MSEHELTGKVRELKELKSFAEQIAREITALEDAIKAEMTAQQTEELTVDIYKVRFLHKRRISHVKNDFFTKLSNLQAI